MLKMPIKLSNVGDADDRLSFVPHRSTEHSAGYDLRTDLNSPRTIFPGANSLIPLGFAASITAGYFGLICMRYDYSLAYGLCLANGTGIVNSGDYRIVGAIVMNAGVEPYTIHPAERIAQLIIMKYEAVDIDIVPWLDVTHRGDGGFGSTGTGNE